MPKQEGESGTEEKGIRFYTDSFCTLVLQMLETDIPSPLFTLNSSYSPTSRYFPVTQECVYGSFFTNKFFLDFLTYSFYTYISVIPRTVSIPDSNIQMLWVDLFHRIIEIYISWRSHGYLQINLLTMNMLLSPPILVFSPCSLPWLTKSIKCS